MDGGGRVALVTGANRGIGLEVARRLVALGFEFVVGARSAATAAEAASTIGAARSVEIDVADPASVADAVDGLGHVDVLVNNAGIYPPGSVLEASEQQLDEVLATNLVGAWRLSRALVPGMRVRRWGRVVNVSSESGSLTTMSTGWFAYRVSKAGLNVLTRQLALELRGSGVLVNSVCPGWVATEMGGAAAPRTVAQGAASVLWAVTLPDGGPTGTFTTDGETIPW